MSDKKKVVSLHLTQDQSEKLRGLAKNDRKSMSEYAGLLIEAAHIRADAADDLEPQ